MLAVDTNIVVRYLTDDDPGQAGRARDVVNNNDIFVASTVFLETEWVLRSTYGFSAGQIANRLGAFAGLPTVTLEAPDSISTALSWMREGMDFADALHLAASEQSDAFVTFDRRLGRLAKRLGGTRVRVLYE